MDDYSFERKIMQRVYATQDGAQHAAPLRNVFQPRIRPIRPPHLRARFSLAHDDIGREIEPTLEQARSHAVGVDGDVLLLELADLLHREATRDYDFDVSIACGIERAPDVPHQLRIHAGRLE